MTVTATADKTIILPNQSVTFTVTASDDDYSFDSVYLYINGVKGADVNTGYGNKSLTYTHTFSSTGTYEVKFYHQNGGKYSNTVTVYVSTYAIEFEEASYDTCGSATVSCVLTDNGVVASGETVSLTGTGSTLTATTDSNGVATFNLNGISASATLTASYSIVFDTASLTYTNPNTLNGSLVCLGRRMASHLTTMGVVDADPSDGLTTLADKILDVEPSISGLDLETEITASASSTSIDVGDTVTFTGTLSAYYDDETVTDVDLQGVLQGATVLIKEGSTTLASGTTDTTGAYSITNTFSTSGTHTVKAVFDGTDNFKDCESSTISITVASITPVVTSVSLTSDKSILSYADSEQATLTATVLDQFNQPMENETVSFAVVGGSTIGSDTTDSNGEATVSYSSEGTGDITVRASVGMIVSETYTIEDCIKYIANPSDYQTFAVPTGNYKIQWNCKLTSMTSATSAINDGTSNYIGLASTHGNIGFYNPNNFLTTPITADNVKHTFELDYNSGTWTFKHNNESVNDTRTLNTSALKVRKMSSNSDSMTEFKIKPL